MTNVNSALDEQVWAMIKELVNDKGFKLKFERCDVKVDHGMMTVTIRGITPKDRAERRRRK